MAVTRLTALLNIREVGERVFSDLAETWWMIGISLVGACLLSFIWILLMRFLAGNRKFFGGFILSGVFQVSADFLRCGYPEVWRIFLHSPKRKYSGFFCFAPTPSFCVGFFSSQVLYANDHCFFCKLCSVSPKQGYRPTELVCHTLADFFHTNFPGFFTLNLA